MTTRSCSISALLFFAGSVLAPAIQAQDAAREADRGVLLIRPTNAEGERRRVSGTLWREDGRQIAVASRRSNRVPAGRYVLEVGIETRNGNLYRPVKREVEVPGGQETAVDVVVEDPPTVSSRFIENGKERKAGHYFTGQITAFQDGVEAFSFRPSVRAPIDEGTYEFRISPNAENQDLSVTESFAAGEHKVIEFEMAHTVRVWFTVVAAGSGVKFQKNLELWQDGAKIKDVSWSRGTWAAPGTYDVHMPDDLTPYVHRGVVVKPGKENELRIEVPVGHLTVVYQRADGSPMRNERFWISRLDADDPEVASRSRTVRGSGVPNPLIPGRYRLEGWEHLGTFEPVEIEIAVGDDHEVVFREKG